MNNIYRKYEASYAEMGMLITECRKHLMFMEKSQPSSKRDIGMKYMSRFYNSQLYILQGNLIEALKGFHDVLSWNPIKWIYSLNTYGNGSYKHCEALYATISNIIQIYCALGLREKARSFSSKHDKVFKELSTEVFVFLSIDNIDNVTIYQNVRDVDIHKTTANLIEKARSCTGDYFIFWNESEFKIDYDVYDIYNKEADVYNFHFGTQYHLIYDGGRPVGVTGYPRWSDSVLESISDMRQQANLLY